MTGKMPRQAADSTVSPRLSGGAREFEAECIEFFSEGVQLFGIPRSVGQIYGLLFASPHPLSFSDIVEQLGVSKGSVSQGLQLLRSLGAINTRPGHAAESAVSPSENGGASRREYFEPELSLRKLLSGVLQERLAPMSSSAGQRLPRMRELARLGGKLSSTLGS